MSDLRYVRQSVGVDPARIPASGETTVALQPSRLIEGRVLDADTGRPIPNAVISASGMVQNEHAYGIFQSKFRADDQGRFAINPAICDDYTLTAFPTGGEPYLSREVELKWTKGTVKATRDIKLKRGVADPRQGDRGRHRPPAARVEHHVHARPGRR